MTCFLTLNQISEYKEAAKRLRIVTSFGRKKKTSFELVGRVGWKERKPFFTKKIVKKKNL
jgi:hypothetical protein